MGLKAGKRKYARKAPVMGAVWVKMKSLAKTNYSSEMDRLAKEAGMTSLDPARKRAYDEGMDAVSEADFTAAVKGKEDKWYNSYVAKMFV